MAKTERTIARVTWWSKEHDAEGKLIRYTDMNVGFGDTVDDMVAQLAKEHPDLDYLSNISVSVPYNYPIRRTGNRKELRK